MVKKFPVYSHQELCSEIIFVRIDGVGQRRHNEISLKIPHTKIQCFSCQMIKGTAYIFDLKFFIKNFLSSTDCHHLLKRCNKN
jgi:hypothetical protein